MNRSIVLHKNITRAMKELRCRFFFCIIKVKIEARIIARQECFDWQRDSPVRDADYEPFDSILCPNRCYDPSYAPSLVAMLVAMLMTMLMAILRAIADRSPLGHRLVPKPTLFRVSLCSPESYR